MKENGGAAACGPAHIAGVAWQGKREHQEDCHSVFVLDGPNGPQTICVLCDGMGGHAAGATASRVAHDAATISLKANPAAPINERLRSALNDANAAVRAQVQRDERFRGMGTTFIAAIHEGERLHWISVGDSPMFVFDGERLGRLNENHSLKDELEGRVKKGELSREDAQRHPQRNALTSAVMGETIHQIDQRDEHFPKGYLAILASDGVETLSIAEIGSIATLHYRDGAAVVTKALIEAVRAKEKPRQDNTTIVTLSCLAPGMPLDPTQTLHRPIRPGLVAAAIALLAAIALAGYLSLRGSSDIPTDRTSDGGGVPPSGEILPGNETSIAQDKPESCILSTNFDDDPGGLREICDCIADGREARIENSLSDRYTLEGFRQCHENNGEYDAIERGEPASDPSELPETHEATGTSPVPEEHGPKAPLRAPAPPRRSGARGLPVDGSTEDGSTAEGSTEEGDPGDQEPPEDPVSGAQNEAAREEEQ